MAVWYLDSDDEITDAVARMRNTTEEHIVFVVPPGSRIATGRINFRLLSREAASRGLNLAIASPDAQVRAMAASAGVLGLATATEAQAALERGETPPDIDESGGSGGGGADQDASAVAVATDATRSGADWRRRRLTATVVIAMMLGVLGLVAALQTMSTALITLTPRTASVGPLELSIMALTTVGEPDVGARLIPAEELSIPLRVAGDFEASGSQTVEARARGSVVFSALDQELEEEVIIPALTRVFTAEGIEFRTTEAATLGPSGSGGAPVQVVTPIEAARPGPEGNVVAGAIDSIPSLESLSVTNPEATTGGRLEETPVVTGQDYDAATVDLQNRLAGALAAQLRDPANAPEGLTVFADTAQLGEITQDPPAEDLVGKQAAEFRLSGATVARVLAVDERLAGQLAESALLAAIPRDMALLPDTQSVHISEGVAEGDRLRFVGTAVAEAYQMVDVDALLSEIAGLPVSEARAILERLGRTSVSVWPEFLGELPGDRNRIRLDVQDPSTTE